MNDVSKLRNYIKQSVKNTITEMREKKLMPPQTFEDFRTMVSDALEQLDMPKDLINIIGDADYHGEFLSPKLFTAYSELKFDLDSLIEADADDETIKDTWNELLSEYIDSSILSDSIKRLSNSDNFDSQDSYDWSQIDVDDMTNQLIDALTL